MFVLFPDYLTESACEWSFNTSVKILTYSVHTHALGKYSDFQRNVEMIQWSVYIDVSM